MAREDQKALTHINLPFIGDGDGKRFEPGEMIPYEDFEAYAQAVARLPQSLEDPSPVHTADSIIEEMTKYGSLSSDPEAQLHPDHIVPTAGEVTIQSAAAQALTLVERLEEQGKPVPPELKAFAETAANDREVSTSEAGDGRDQLVHE